MGGLVRSCLYDRPVTTGHAGEQAGVQLYLAPTAARRLLGVPMEDLVNRVVALEDLLGAAATRSLESAEDPFARLDALLARRLDPGLVAPEVEHALARVTSGARVEAVAAEVGWSRRHLAARFRRDVGLPPRALRRLARAARAAELLRAPGADLADVAYGLGYADQPHFTREFKAFAGVTPARFPNVQDTLTAA